VAHQLALHGPTGRRLWTRDETGQKGGPKDRLLKAVDVAVDESGRIAVLAATAEALLLFDSKGTRLRAISLARKWARDATYPNDLATDGKGGFLIHHRSAPRPLIRLDGEGKVVKTLNPTQRDGRRIDVRETMRADATGRIWVTDGTVLYRLGESGVADRTLGVPPSPRTLTQVADLMVDAGGQVYAVDRETGSVHVFNKRGKRQFVATPPGSSLREGSPQFLSLQVARSGDIFLSSVSPLDQDGLSTRGDGTLRFSPRGKFLGYQPFPALGYEPVTPPAAVRPAWRWDRTALLDEQGRVVARLNRWPNDDWMLRGPSAVAPDGRLMAYEPSGDGAGGRLAFYSATGKPLGAAALPPGLAEMRSVAYDGKAVYFLRAEDILAVDPSGKPLWSFRPPGEDHRKIFPSGGGVALWSGENTVTWFAIPSGSPRK
jgi:hypothetical protein